jgi:hypothetical protein
MMIFVPICDDRAVCKVVYVTVIVVFLLCCEIVCSWTVELFFYLGLTCLSVT